MNLEQALMAAVVTLGSAIALVYRDLRKRLEVCEVDRQNLWAEIRKLAGMKQRTDP